MTLSINPPFPTFQDVDGKPLENGFIYIGAENLDPQVNPIAVYWDAGLTQLAAQPIRTNGGYPVNSGTPARVYVGAAYSIRVMDKKGRVVYSSPSDTLFLDSSHVSFTQYGVNSITRTVEEKLYELFSIVDKGAVGDGVTVSTSAIQTALNQGGLIYVPAGTYLTGPLTASTTIPTTLVFHPGAEFYATAGYGENDKMLTVGLNARMVIHGNGATMRMRKPDYTTNEQRHVINVFGAALFHAHNLNCNDSGGDGFYIGGNSNEPTQDALLVSCGANNNRRQGLSIVNAIKCHVIGGSYTNTIGTAPECGIDVESNLLPGYFLTDILIDGAYTAGNNGGGVLITPQSKANPVHITAINCTSENDGIRGGLSLSAAMAFRTVAPITDAANIGKIQGRIFVDNMTIFNPKGRGIGMINWGENAPSTEIGTVTVINPCSDPALDTNDIHRCAMLVRSELGSGGRYTTGVGHVTIKNLIAIDNRTVKKMVVPLYVNMADEASQPFTNFTFENIEAVKAEWTSAAITPILFGATKALNCRGNYTKPRYAEAASGTVLTFAHAGMTFYAPGGANYTLGLLANYPGTEVEVLIRNAFNLNLNPNAVDIIDIYSGGVAGNPAASSTVGSRLKVRAIEGATRWEVVNAVGTWA